MPHYVLDNSADLPVNTNVLGQVYQHQSFKCDKNNKFMLGRVEGEVSERKALRGW
jgi:hypothetical protein